MISTEAGQEWMHRWVLEQKIGRKLRRGELAHHKNGDGHDNREENLELMTNREHSRHHLPGRLMHPRWGTCGYRNPPGVWSKAFSSCQGCGTTGKRHKAHGLCNRCHMRERKAHRLTPGA